MAQKKTKRGSILPWVGFDPNWLGAGGSLGLSRTRSRHFSRVWREGVLGRFHQQNHRPRPAPRRSPVSAIEFARANGVSSGFFFLPVQILWRRNKDLSFFFLSQLILAAGVVLALPFIVLYKGK